MFTDPTLTLADQLFWIVELFCKTMAAEACKRRIGEISGPLWNLVRGLERRFRALHAQWKAGTLAPARGRKSTSPRPCPHSGEGACGAGGAVVGGGVAGALNTRPASLLPRGLRWMQTVLPMSAGTLGSMLGPLLFNHPEMQTFMAEAPQVGRILRPLCRLVGLKPPDYLALPKRRGTRHPPPHPSPSRGEGDLQQQRRRRRTPQEIAAAAIERSNRTGKPIDPRKLSAAAYGCVLHWPRDSNCPPPEIGYGGRSFPALPKDYVPPKDWE